jgi:hypothetical protein
MPPNDMLSVIEWPWSCCIEATPDEMLRPPKIAATQRRVKNGTAFLVTPRIDLAHTSSGRRRTTCAIDQAPRTSDMEAGNQR